MNVPSNSPRILIVGAGIAGLTLAAGLGQRGLRAHVVEVQPAPNAAGIGIAQPGNALRALQSIGAAQACLDAGFQSDEYRYFDPDGDELATLKMLRIADANLPAVNFMSRTALHQILMNAAETAGARLRFGTTVTDIRNSAEAAEVVFSDGSRQTYDLVVGADGIRSSVRRMVYPEAEGPRYTGCAAWRFLARRPDVLSYQRVYMGVGARAGLVPISAKEMFVFIVTNEPKDFRVRPEDAHALLAARMAQFNDQIMRDAAKDAESAANIVYTPLEEVILQSPWHRDRVVLIGDAAHASSPHVAQGAAMALEDSVLLAEVLAKPMPLSAALESFYIRRYGRCRFVQDFSRKTGEEGQLSDPEACRRRNMAIRERFSKPQPRPHEWVLNEPI